MDTREMIKKHNIRLTRSLGQNFLTDEKVVERIVEAADIGEKDLVIEIGPGLGSMTRLLAQKAGGVIAVEIDRRLINPLQEVLAEYDNVKIINDDIMRVNLKDIISGYTFTSKPDIIPSSAKVVANLPYYITTPVIMKILEDNLKIDMCVFMVQKEVADRMVAKPGGKDFGALSVAVQYRSRPEKIFEVPPHCFIPQPDVYSTVIRLNVYKIPPVQVKDEKIFFKVVKASFGQRRKTLTNALYNSGYFTMSKDEISEILKNIGINPNQRGETLSIMQFAELANAFFLKNH